MSSFTSVLDELESALQSGAMGRRTTVLRQITDLFTSGAENFSQQQIALFDDVMSHLINHIESRALVELSSRLAPVGNAPARVIRRLAADDAIEVAGPVLAQSEQLTRDDLVEIAKKSGQAHLMKIASRSRLDEAVTDVLVDRGDSEVANQVAANSGARFSKTGYSKLVLWAEGDDQLTATLARRSDIDPHLFRQLLAHATETVRETLIASAQPEVRDAVKRILTDISGHISNAVTSRHYARAQQLVSSFSQDTALTKSKLFEFANTNRLAETVAALSMLSAVPIDLVDRLMHDASYYGVMILCKAVGADWAVARAVLLSRQGPVGAPALELGEICEEYDKLSASSAQRLLRFWQARQAMLGPAKADVREKYYLTA